MYVSFMLCTRKRTPTKLHEKTENVHICFVSKVFISTTKI